MIDEPEISFLGDVQKLSLKPGDVIVISTDMKVSSEVADHLGSYVKGYFPDNKVMILSDGLKVGVLEREAA